MSNNFIFIVEFLFGKTYSYSGIAEVTLKQFCGKVTVKLTTDRYHGYLRRSFIMYSIYDNRCTYFK